MSEEETGEHRFEGTKNEEGQSGTICSANNGKGNANSGTGYQTNYSRTTYDISTREATKGVEAIYTTNDISTGQIAEGIEVGYTTNDIFVGKTIEGVMVGS